MRFPLTLLHVNYFERTRGVGGTFDFARSLRADGVEFRLGGTQHGSAAYLEEIVREQERAPLTALSFGATLNLLHPSRSVRDREVKSWMGWLEFLAPRVPLTVLNLRTGGLEDPARPHWEYEAHGSRLQTAEIFDRQVEALKDLATHAESIGVALALETHHGFCHDQPGPAAALVDAVGSDLLGVLLDFGNLIGFQPVPDLETTIRELGSRIRYVHLKNAVLTGERPPLRCALAEGVIDHRTYWQLLEKYCPILPPICLEAPRPGDREYFAGQDLPYFRSLLC